MQHKTASFIGGILPLFHNSGILATIVNRYK